MSNSQGNTQGRVIGVPLTTQTGETLSADAARTCAVCGGASQRKFCDAACYRIWQRSRPIGERFWSRVNKLGPIHPTQPELGECWMWTGTKTGRDGYGGIFIAHHQRPGFRYPRPTYVHRLSWELANGPIPPARQVLHSCDRPSCVNPTHLRLGDHAANMNDAAVRGRLHVPRPRGRKVTDAQIAVMFDMDRAGTPRHRIADHFEVSKGFVSLVLNGHRRAERPVHQQASGF